ENMNKEKSDYCEKFIDQVRLQMMQLNDGEEKTPFGIVSDALFVKGPSGKDIQVAAKTILGPQGEITFHRGSLMLLNPFNTLLLLAHEFGHKVSFQGQYVEDNKPYGPFTSGRDFLDRVGKTIAQYAKDRGYVKSYFGVNDFFSCDVIISGAGDWVQKPNGKSPRLYSSEDYKEYQAGIGRTEDDFQVAIGDADQNTYSLKLEINEYSGCDENPSILPDSHLAILKYPPKLSDGTQPAPTILEEKKFAENPMCEGANPEFDIEIEGLRFECRYSHSKGFSHDKAHIASLRERAKE
ncbi:MAG: hypothetical protein AAF203_11175, partial [Pseudomonadota bacterium]